MMVANCSAAGLGLSWIGELRCKSSQLKSKSPGGCSGRLMVGSPGRTPAAMPGQSSSLPINTRADSECSSTCATDSAVRLGYKGTDTWPAIQIARSAMTQWAQFLEIIAT